MSNEKQIAGSTLPTQSEVIKDTFDLTLLANFVHQIVNPLNGIAGTLDNLVEDVIEEQRRKQRLNAARAQIEQCITLLRNLAFLAKGSGGVADQDKRQVVLPQVIIESAMFFQEDAAINNIRIELDDRRTQNKVVGHPELIRQVLMNIFDNCTKYGKFGSSVAVKQWIQSNSENAVITIRSESKHHLDAGDMTRMFELGFRGGNAKRTIASGTGLGLYICKQIIEQHNGFISVQSDGPSGLMFTIKLPNGRRA
ncbi:ATP-binding protein [Xanthomonas floridensis]|uniref:histidine kinase n=1 Tax=Xanthomonas floridensis TaxID=1843580 RepID=A0ABU5Q350_9XANT|nr:HAMP domain-containing sensor histidine kinase [Xanthomonas floridensis]MEA5126088.1 HAMP domain-containing sensor histidine kinase [Xanthomonas floridensis]MEA5133968.1 HAMP domain-containing sensor histidine kinase [Xanthomonas floridensis]